jgi:uncharacterized membrane protein
MSRIGSLEISCDDEAALSRRLLAWRCWAADGFGLDSGSFWGRSFVVEVVLVVVIVVVILVDISSALLFRAEEEEEEEATLLLLLLFLEEGL